MEKKVKCIVCRKEMIDYDDEDDAVEPQDCLDCGKSFCNDCYFIDPMMKDRGFCPKCLHRHNRCWKEISHILAKLKEKREKQRNI